MSERVVGIAEFMVTMSPDDVIVTYGLGSCVAVVLHDPRRRTGGMLHLMLPSIEAVGESGAKQPARFADSGIPILFNQMYRLGSRKEDLSVWVVGGASVGPPGVNLMAIGERNLEATRQILGRAGVRVRAEDVGGTISRTVRLHVGEGRVQVTSCGVARNLERRSA